MTGAELMRAGSRSRHRRGRRAPRRALRRHRATHPRAEVARTVRATCASRWPAPRSRAIPRRFSTERGRSSPPRSATTGTGRRPSADEGRLAAIHVARRVRRATRTARRAGTAARRLVSRPRRRERPRRSGCSRARGRRVLREEHDGDHPAARVVGRARRARHRRRDRDHAGARARLRRMQAVHRRLPDGRARRAGHPRRDASASRTGRKRRRPFRRSTERSSGQWSTAATSARTCARGIAASRSDGVGRTRLTGVDGRVSLADWLSRDGDELVADLDRLYVPRNEARWLRRNALIAAGNVGSARARAVGATVRGRPRPDPQRRSPVGARAHRGSRRVTAGLDNDRLAVLVHEVRSPVAALAAVAETAADSSGGEPDALASSCGSRWRRVGRSSGIVMDVAVASVRLEPWTSSALVRDAVAAHRVRSAAVASLRGRGTPRRRRSRAPAAGRRQPHRECARPRRLVRGDGSRIAKRRQRPRRRLRYSGLGSRPTSSTGSSTPECVLTPRHLGRAWGSPLRARSQRRTAALSRHGRLRAWSGLHARAARAARSTRHCRLQLVVAEPTPVRGVLADRQTSPETTSMSTSSPAIRTGTPPTKG